MRKSAICLLLIFLLTLSGCAGQDQQYSIAHLTLFDTVTTITGTAASQDEFQSEAKQIYDVLLEYHQLFDIYNDYEGLNNLKTVNENAGIAPVAVDRKIIDLLQDCRTYYEQTDGTVNVAMGSVLQLWHEARQAETAALPDAAALAQAALHCSWDTVVIDESAGTVYLSDPQQRLDVGAIAKGWAAERVAEAAPSGYLLSLGGNVVATGPKTQQGAPWVVGVTDPDGGAYLHTLNLSDGSIVTSGDYQRYYEVDGVRYHHIIDPQTGYPSMYWRSVTVICEDSGLADALSTALFVMDLESGKALLEQCGAHAMWVDAEGTLHYSSGFEAYIKD